MDIFVMLAPLLISTLSPLVTGLFKSGAEAVTGSDLPDTVKPVINSVFGGLLAAFTAFFTAAAPPETVIPLGVIGAQLGGTVRDALVLKPRPKAPKSKKRK